MIAAYGRHFLVESVDLVHACVVRGKRANALCGDHVLFRPISDNEGVIETVLPRASLLYREDMWRRKALAANVTQAVVVVAAAPPCHDELLTRILVAAESQGIQSLIVQNKVDLDDESAALSEDLERYTHIGYPVVRLCATRDARPLRPYLQGHTSILVGQSGVGKSTLINRLVPDADARTREISAALGSGRHTTTHTRLYRLSHDTALMDSPGLQAFGLGKLPLERMAHAFREFRPHLGKCRFRNCRHVAEPGCAVLAAAKAGEIGSRRLAHYHTLLREQQGGYSGGVPAREKV